MCKLANNRVTKQRCYRVHALQNTTPMMQWTSKQHLHIQRIHTFGQGVRLSIVAGNGNAFCEPYSNHNLTELNKYTKVECAVLAENGVFIYPSKENYPLEIQQLFGGDYEPIAPYLTWSEVDMLCGYLIYRYGAQ